MIYFNMNNLDETKKLFEEEKKFIENRKKSQNNYKNIILQYINNFIDFNSVDIDSTSSVLKFLENLKDCLEFCTTNISKLNTIILDLDKVKLAMQNNDNNIEEMLNNFNKIYLDLNTTIMENTLKIEQCILSIAEKSELKISKTVVETNSVEDKSDIQEKNNSTICETEKSDFSDSNTKKHKKSKKIETTDIKQTVSNKPREYKENTLIISETDKKVFLPYYMTDLNEILNDNPKKYSSIDDVIDKKYTLPISHFKNPFVSRFKEAFKLMRNKERSSVIDAFELCTELMFESNLYPAIITACKNLDELDIYLDYLDSGETDKFKCFNIEFELPPALVK